MIKVYLSENEIVKEIKEYIKLKNVNYAILVDGSWGSGKTFFLKNHLIKKLENTFSTSIVDKALKRKVIYISLYGISNINDLTNKIIINLISDEKTKKLVPILNVGLNVLSDLIKKYTSVDNAGENSKELFNSFYSIDNTIIVFDDLERCNLKINVILGYINNLIEHNKIKSIIVADESKIGKANYEDNTELKYLVSLQGNIVYDKVKDKNPLSLEEPIEDGKYRINEIKKNAETIFSQNILYNEIKEKVIGKTIYYKPNIPNIYNKVVRDIVSSKKVQKILIDNKNILIDELTINSYWNIRTIQFIFHTFDKVYSVISNMKLADKINKQLMIDIFKYCIIKSLVVKNGKSKYNWENDNVLLGEVFLDEKDDYSSKNYVKGFRFVDDYILYSHLNKEKIEKSVNEYIYLLTLENNNPNDPIYKLNYWWNSSEIDLSVSLDEVLIKAQKNEYVLNLYSKIVWLISNIFRTNLFSEKIQKIISALEENLEKNSVNGDFFDRDLFMETKEISDIYNSNIKKIRELAINKTNADKKDSIIKFLCNTSWATDIIQYYKENEGKFLEDKRFMLYFNLDRLMIAINSSNNEEIYQFRRLINSVYRSSNIYEYYADDITILEELLSNLNKIISSKQITDGIKIYAINSLIDSLKLNIKKLKNE